MTRECDDADRREPRATDRSELESFAALIGHELRQPLAAAANLAALAEAECEGARDGAQRHRMRQIRTLIQRTAELLTAQTALASAWPRRTSPRTVSLRQVAEGALLELKPQLERAAVRVEIGTLPRLRVDPGLLRQLFRNLIENAVRYRRAGVPLTIVIRAEARTPEPGWTIHIRDNGRGFPPHQAEAIFTPFEQLDGGAQGGHGVGLALCRRIAELHGGTVTAVGGPGEGATFHLVLPHGDRVQGAAERLGCGTDVAAPIRTQECASPSARPLDPVEEEEEP